MCTCVQQRGPAVPAEQCRHAVDRRTQRRLSHAHGPHRAYHAPRCSALCAGRPHWRSMEVQAAQHPRSRRWTNLDVRPGHPTDAVPRTHSPQYVVRTHKRRCTCHFWRRLARNAPRGRLRACKVKRCLDSEPQCEIFGHNLKSIFTLWHSMPVHNAARHRGSMANVRDGSPVGKGTERTPEMDETAAGSFRAHDRTQRWTDSRCVQQALPGFAPHHGCLSLSRTRRCNHPTLTIRLSVCAVTSCPDIAECSSGGATVEWRTL